MDDEGTLTQAFIESAFHNRSVWKIKNGDFLLLTLVIISEAMAIIDLSKGYCCIENAGQLVLDLSGATVPLKVAVELFENTIILARDLRDLAQEKLRL